MHLPPRPSLPGVRRALLLSLLCSTAAWASEPAHAPPPEATSHTGGHWGYGEAVGPAHWGDLPGATTCATGKEESPVELVTANTTPDTHPAPSFNYRPSRVRMVNNGHTVEFEYDAGSTVRVGEKEYQLAQFHFHTPSEHTEDGVHFPLELHLVHKNTSGGVLVVGVFIKAGSVNRALDDAFHHLPWNKGDHSEPKGASINASALLPKNKAFFQYHGSLTTPPCTEGVEWYVMKDPIEMSDAEIASFQRLPHLNPNNRPPQPLNGRTVYLHASTR
ncbi:carbonic anhydrase [Myxococcus sp. RHSTA-1-4]|uniref:carbonic anhydrase n=1 Tax=Myxococcus sp. RHSTA-1-4 TaxID=2874601 RepID=UPI001CBF6577|nr:carbonic anhydrase family protein [Myxococcus sp. RHSTA-1-4]MBZ4415815.1 carbonic anhydrase family protein [Myxococcus sp. RHSTA-1-4]